MIIKTGIDVIEVSRIKENIIKFNDAFLNRVFTEKEIEYCEAKNVQKYQTYSGRFAAKEAVFKALSDFIDNKFDIEWKDIEVLNNEAGRPYVNLSSSLKNMISIALKNSEFSVDIDISISHISEIAVANVVVKMEV